MLPVPVADGVLNDTLPEHTIQTARELKFFLAENAKSARAFLKFCGHPSPIASLSIEEIGHRPDSAKVRGWQENYMEGLVKEYANFLNDDKKPASERFWELEKRIKEEIGRASCRERV